MILGVNNDDLRRAACQGTDPELFFRKADELKAKAICGRCPVRDACLNTALQNELVYYLAGLADGRRAGIQLDGVYGGWTAGERTGLVYRRAQQALQQAAA